MLMKDEVKRWKKYGYIIMAVVLFLMGVTYVVNYNKKVKLHKEEIKAEHIEDLRRAEEASEKALEFLNSDKETVTGKEMKEYCKIAGTIWTSINELREYTVKPYNSEIKPHNIMMVLSSTINYGSMEDAEEIAIQGELRYILIVQKWYIEEVNTLLKESSYKNFKTAGEWVKVLKEISTLDHTNIKTEAS